MAWGEIVPSTFTICTKTRYTPGGSAKERILSGESNNWLHGHWSSKAGLAYYGGFNTPEEGVGLNSEDWLVMCGQNGGHWIFRVNGQRDVGNAQNSIDPGVVWTNGGLHSPESSDFDIMEIITWNRALSTDEIYAVIDHLSAMEAPTP
jgi:hypothetical protein